MFLKRHQSLVHALGPGGMSNDKRMFQNSTIMFIVVLLDWRDPNMTNFLHLLDLEYARTKEMESRQRHRNPL